MEQKEHIPGPVSLQEEGTRKGLLSLQGGEQQKWLRCPFFWLPKGHCILEAEERHGWALHILLKSCFIIHFQHHSPSSASVQKAQIWNNLYSCFPLKLSSHFHPSGYGKVPIYPFLGSDVCDYSSASRGLHGLPRGDRQFSEPRSLICKVCVRM